MNIFSKAAVYLRMIKFSHTIFALPFALSALVLVHAVKPVDMKTVVLIVLAMAAARSAAMGFNRIADAKLDALNPRTAVREIPRGTISSRGAVFFTAISSVLFVVIAGLLSRLCLWLSFPTLALVFAYSWTKRVTSLAHLFLGLAIGISPMAVWVAVTGAMPRAITVLSLALMTYIAGFDILYACQDVEFDRKQGLHSIPAYFGVERAMTISTLLHVASVLLLVGIYSLFPLHPVYLGFIAAIGVLFVVEHRLVHPEDLSKIDIAFFHVNSVISLLVLAAVLSGRIFY